MNNPYKQIELKPVVETVAQEALRLLSAVPEELWHVGHYSSPCGEKHCGLGWISEKKGSYYEVVQSIKKYSGRIDTLNDVNDGLVDNYSQPTPKQRVVALLTDMVNAGY